MPAIPKIDDGRNLRAPDGYKGGEIVVLENRIDFLGVVIAEHTNPNGDPSNGNRPRQLYDGRGEISDVCLKRKIRDRLQDMGHPIFVQSDDKKADGFSSLAQRAKSIRPQGQKNNEENYCADACRTWFDVRAFGQVFAFPGGVVSTPVRGPVSISSAISLDIVEIYDVTITKSASSYETGQKRRDTMGERHYVDHGAYVFRGSISTQLASLTGFSGEDAKILRAAILTMFADDISSARPAGGLELHRLYWWEHNCPTGQYSPAKVFRTVSLLPCDKWPYYTATHTSLSGLSPTIYTEGELDVE